jgi:hypothetical protein
VSAALHHRPELELRCHVPRAIRTLGKPSHSEFVMLTLADINRPLGQRYASRASRKDVL